HRAVAFLLHAKKYRKKEMPKLAPDCPEFHFQVAKKHRGKRVGTQLIIHFLEQLPAGRHEKVCMQITACEASKPLEFYTSIKYKGDQIWKVYDRKETGMYTKKEKKKWDLGPVVENITLIADRRKLLLYFGSKA
ncbi:MAG: hypothetical protein U9Q81_08740, partial [Pseudomonadota bacterium]|nr:hypothetical protein [Pseudomonadota bacterium]